MPGPICVFSFFAPTPRLRHRFANTFAIRKKCRFIFTLSRVASLSLGCCEAPHATRAGITPSPKSLPGQASGHLELGATRGANAFAPPSSPTRHGTVTFTGAVSQWPRAEKSGHPCEKMQLLIHQVTWRELGVNLCFVEKDALFLCSIVLDFLVTIEFLDLKPPRKELNKS